VVGLVVPTGYSFNLDGTSIYLTMAAIFIAQAFNIQLGLGEQLGILAVLLLTSKGAAAVTGGGFITLAATLSSTSTVPVAGLALLLGVDRFMSECRAITNLIGNGVATLVVARWENELNRSRLQDILTREPDEEADETPEGLMRAEPVDRVVASRAMPDGAGSAPARDKGTRLLPSWPADHDAFGTISGFVQRVSFGPGDSRETLHCPVANSTLIANIVESSFLIQLLCREEIRHALSLAGLLNPGFPKREVLEMFQRCARRHH
jgi:hypothetical protein